MSRDSVTDMKGNLVVLGDTIKDAVTDMKGVLTSITVWVNGCVRVGIQPIALTKEGLPADIQTLDVEQIVLIKGKKNLFSSDAKKSGGPKPDSLRR